MTQDATDGAGTPADEAEDLAVSFGEVAAEPADESVRRERDALGDPADDDPEVADAILDHPGEDNTAPQEPTISSMLGGGPVSPGDDPMI